MSGGAGLSSGEAQLLALSRVFLEDPDVVVLDEPTSRLDRATEALIDGALDELATGRTVLLIAHHLATVERCDDILVLEDGRVVEMGERERLAADPGSRFHELLHTGLEGDTGVKHLVVRLAPLSVQEVDVHAPDSERDRLDGGDRARGVALAQREVFDTLTGDGGVFRWACGRCALCSWVSAWDTRVAFVGDELLFRFNRFTLSTLLQRKCLRPVSSGSGEASSLPASPGEAVSRFRGDVRQAVMPMMDVDLLVANFLFFVIAMAIMARISAFDGVRRLPAAVRGHGVRARCARGRIRQYREDAREAAGGVTGVIGEIFGMVETVKVSNAEGRVIEEFERVNSERGRTSLKDEVLEADDGGSSLRTPTTSRPACPARAAREVDGAGGDLTVGDLSLFVFYLGNTNWP